ncbi:unnamed protein product [Ixodes persulcatus]
MPSVVHVANGNGGRRRALQRAGRRCTWKRRPCRNRPVPDGRRAGGAPQLGQPLSGVDDRRPPLPSSDTGLAAAPPRRCCERLPAGQAGRPERPPGRRQFPVPQ